MLAVNTTDIHYDSSSLTTLFYLDACDVLIGTPPRSFRLLADSGSADLWLGSESCHNNEGKSCVSHS